MVGTSPNSGHTASLRPNARLRLALRMSTAVSQNGVRKKNALKMRT